MQQQQPPGTYGGSSANDNNIGYSPSGTTMQGYGTPTGANPMYMHGQHQQPQQPQYQQQSSQQQQHMMYNSQHHPMYSTPTVQSQQPYYGQPEQQQQPYFNQQPQQQAIYGQPQHPAYYGQPPQPYSQYPPQQQPQYPPPQAPQQPQYPPPQVPQQQQPQYAPPQAPQQQQQQRRGRMMRPPYVDPITNMVYETEPSDYEGYLTKQSVWLKEWRRRYFILKGSKLFFGKNESAAPHGMLDLALATTVKSADLKSKKRHSMEISTPETCYLLYADTESEKDDWIGRVGKAIVRCSRTYYSKSQMNDGGGPNNPMTNENNDDDDIYTNDDPDNPYFND